MIFVSDIHEDTDSVEPRLTEEDIFTTTSEYHAYDNIIITDGVA